MLSSWSPDGSASDRSRAPTWACGGRLHPLYRGRVAAPIPGVAATALVQGSHAWSCRGDRRPRTGRGPHPHGRRSDLDPRCRRRGRGREAGGRRAGGLRRTGKGRGATGPSSPPRLRRTNPVHSQEGRRRALPGPANHRCGEVRRPTRVVVVRRREGVRPWSARVICGK